VGHPANTACLEPQDMHKITLQRELCLRNALLATIFVEAELTTKLLRNKAALKG
jgi:hypothetical protein